MWPQVTANAIIAAFLLNVQGLIMWPWRELNHQNFKNCQSENWFLSNNSIIMIFVVKSHNKSFICRSLNIFLHFHHAILIISLTYLIVANYSSCINVPKTSLPIHLPLKVQFRFAVWFLWGKIKIVFFLPHPCSPREIGLDGNINCELP